MDYGNSFLGLTNIGGFTYGTMSKSYDFKPSSLLQSKQIAFNMQNIYYSEELKEDKTIFIHMIISFEEYEEQ